MNHHAHTVHPRGRFSGCEAFVDLHAFGQQGLRTQHRVQADQARVLGEGAREPAGLHQELLKEAHDTVYLKSPFLAALTLIFSMVPPLAMRFSTCSAICGKRVSLRMWSTLRAPVSTSVQRASTASTSLVS